MYADWLIDHGDPLGDLINTALAIEVEENRKKLAGLYSHIAVIKERYSVDWIGELAHHQYASVSFERGLPQHAELTNEKQLTRLSGRWAAKLLRSIRCLGHSELRWLTEFPALTHLELHKARRSHLEELPELSKLSSLKVEGAVSAKGLERLSKQPSLRTLHVSHCRVRSVRGFTKLESLRNLVLGEITFKQVTELAKMKTLRTLSLYCPELAGAPKLVDLSHLDSLSLRMPRTDAGFGALTQREKVLAGLRELAPNASIVYD